MILFKIVRFLARTATNKRKINLRKSNINQYLILVRNNETKFAHINFNAVRSLHGMGTGYIRMGRE